MGALLLPGMLAYLVLAIEYPLLLRRTGIMFLPAFLATAAWHLVALPVVGKDSLLVATWALSLVLKLEFSGQLQRGSGKWFVLWAIPLVSIVLTLLMVISQAVTSALSVFSHIMICVATLLVTEQVIRNSGRLIQGVGIGIGTFLLFDLYVYTEMLIYGTLNTGLMQTRLLGLAVVGWILVLLPMFLNTAEFRRRRVELSRPLVFSTTSLLLAGGFLVVVSTMGALVDNQYLGQFAQPLLMFVAVFSVGLTMASPRYRARFRVWLNKHFFATKFDYSQEWRKLSERLTLASSEQQYEEVAVKAVREIYRLNGGVYYRRMDGVFRPTWANGVPLGNLASLPIADSSEFEAKLIEGWIFTPMSSNSQQTRFNDLLPEELPVNALIVLPVTSGNVIRAMIVVIDEERIITDLDWEDLDLLRMVGEQISYFVTNEIINDELVVTRQFEAYHRITAFVMHDLKNLIAQQALVVENARRFIDNPEFVADAMTTIENSVGRMNRLLIRIRQGDELDTGMDVSQKSSLQAVLSSALEKCHKTPPVNLELDSDILVVGDVDNLTTGFTHLLTNAQEACNTEDGRVVVSARVDGNRVHCAIEDNGIGMSQEFMDNELFRPFHSTKGRTGMGIGAYQSREIFERLGADFSVESVVGEGTCFRISLLLGDD